jgi:hypothetical protein
MNDASFSNIKISPELQAFLTRLLTFHRVLWVLTLVIFLVAWNRGLALLYGLFALLAALLLVSYLMPGWQLRKISVSREPTGDFTVGKPGRIHYRLEANGIRYHVDMRESLPFADQKEPHFFFNKISGRTSCTLEFDCVQRGCFQLARCRLSSAYPFGIVAFTRWTQTDPVEVLVFPRVVDLSRLPMPLVGDERIHGDVLIPQAGGRDEFASVREYSHGDEFSRIHWPVSARHQDLVVKIYEKTDRPALLIVLDCRPAFNVGKGGRSTFEYAVSIAASMIRFATRQGIQCILTARQDQLRERVVQAHTTDLYSLYEFCARLKFSDNHPYSPLVEEAHRRFPRANLVTTFRLDSDTRQPGLAPHVTHIDIEMSTESFGFLEPAVDPKGSRREGNRLVFPVNADQKLEDIFL